MSKHASTPPSRYGRSSIGGRLDSWKEIAAHLRREVRTVQRWEKFARLPVHRLQIDKQSAVYAYESELDAWYKERQPVPRTAERIRSVVVLPLESLSDDPEQDYFADGMTEALITGLAKISALRVISRTTAMRYKGTRKSLPDIARELKVEAVVEGSVLRVGKRARISTRLVRATSDTQIWAQSYDSDLRDLLTLQGEVVQAIAGEIRVRVTRTERQRLRQAREVDPEAHEAYLLGRFFWNKGTPESLNKGLEYFQRAVGIDPSYGLAYAGMADSYVLLGSMVLEVTSPGEAMPKARAAAQQALGIDESLGSAHATLAYISASYDYDWKAAESEFGRALELDPGYATAHHWYSLVLARQGRLNEAKSEMEIARRLDPLSLVINSEMAWLFYVGGDCEGAIEQACIALDLDPKYPGAHLYLVLIYMRKGMLAEALTHAEHAASSWGQSAPSLALVAGCCAALGRTTEAKHIIDELQELSKRRYVSPFAFAWVCLHMGEKERALRYLEQAYVQRSSYLVLLKVEPLFDSIRSDPRFRDLQGRVGLLP